MRIMNIVTKLCSQHETNNPFAIAENKNIITLFEPLGSIHGFYQSIYNQKIIHINEDLSEQEQKFTCAHELGHIVLHNKINTSFLKTKTLFSVDRYENEANKFAVLLLYSEEEFKQYLNLSIPQIAQCLNLSNELVEYRIKQIESKNIF